jgi:capsular exopolysaccharide synthesis family protein
MSRFYNAFRKSRHTGSKGAQELTWEPVVYGGLNPPDSEANPIAADRARVENADLWAIEANELSAEGNSSEGDAVQCPITGAFKRKALIRNSADPLVLEQYRKLRTKLVQCHANRAFQSLLVTSPAPDEGKTVTVLNMALSFAMLSSFRVLVVDGDLRRGTLGQWLGVGERPGLSNLIEGSVTLNEVVLRSDAIPIHFIGSGTSKAPAGELLPSPRLPQFFQQIKEKFALILVDSPPVNLLTDAQLLANCCDGVILITRAFSTTRKALERAAHDLQPYRVLGSILNGATRSQMYGRYNRYY